MKKFENPRKGLIFSALRISVFSMLLLFLFCCTEEEAVKDQPYSDYHNLKNDVISAASEGNDRLALFLEAVLKIRRGELRGELSFILGSMLIDEAEERLIFLSKHKDASLRILAAEALGIRGGAGSVSTLALLLDDNEESVRDKAAESLALINSTGGRKALSEALLNKQRQASKAALAGMGFSRYRSEAERLEASLLESWKSSYLKPEFIDMLMTIRRLVDEKFAFKKREKNREDETVDFIRTLGILGDGDSLKLLLDNSSALFDQGGRGTSFEAAVQSIAIIPDENAVIHLFSLESLAIKKKNLRKKQLLEKTIDGCFDFHKYLIIKGGDDYKLQGLKSFPVFGITRYKKDAEEFLHIMKNKKSRNPLVANQIRSCLIFFEKTNDRIDNRY